MYQPNNKLKWHLLRYEKKIYYELPVFPLKLLFCFAFYLEERMRAILGAIL